VIDKRAAPRRKVVLGNEKKELNKDTKYILRLHGISTAPPVIVHGLMKGKERYGHGKSW
jgi:hypothetical protein